MPLGQNNMRGPGMQNIQSYAITDNPVFKVKIRSLATNLEQTAKKSRDDSITDYTKKFKVGDLIKGKNTTDKKVYSGKVIKIEKNEEGEGAALIIIDKKTKDKVKLDASTCYKQESESPNNRDGEKLSFFADSRQHILSYHEFLLNN